MAIKPATNSLYAHAEHPRPVLGPKRWLRNNLFRNWFDTLLTLVVVLVLVSIAERFFTWATGEAQWAVVTANFRVLMQGLYPIGQGWRLVVAVIVITLLAGMSWGIWGRMFASTGFALAFGAVLFVLVPAPRRSLTDSSPLEHYLSAEVFPLLDIVRSPVLALVGCLLFGYFVGRIARTRSLQGARRFALIAWFLSMPLLFVLVRGFGPDASWLPLVATSAWGGLLLTFMLAFVAIVTCFPLGILLALGRTSGPAWSKGAPRPAFWHMNPREWYIVGMNHWRDLGPYPVINLFCVAYIEFFRGVPLITVFFTANLLVPLALGSTVIEPVVRAMIALSLFEAAYIAEIVRGGLQALPQGQIEAAKALGLNVVYATLFVILPQALRFVIPALVGQFITMFKDTSLVAIVGLLDLLGIAQGVLAQQQFTNRHREMYVFLAVVYFIFSFGMSRAARQLERSGSGKHQFKP